MSDTYVFHSEHLQVYIDLWVLLYYYQNYAVQSVHAENLDFYIPPKPYAHNNMPARCINTCKTKRAIK